MRSYYCCVHSQSEMPGNNDLFLGRAAVSIQTQGSRRLSIICPTHQERPENRHRISYTDASWLAPAWICVVGSLVRSGVGAFVFDTQCSGPNGISTPLPDPIGTASR